MVSNPEVDGARGDFVLKHVSTSSIMVNSRRGIGVSACQVRAEVS